MTAPPNPQALAQFRQVTARHRAGDVAAALAAYDALVDRLGDHADLWNNRGIALTQLGRLAEAEASYARAVALDPGHADSHVNLGIARGRQGDMAAAVAAFDRALALNPGHPAARGNRAAALAAMTAQPPSPGAGPTARLAEAEALATQGRAEDALVAFTIALRQGGDTAIVHARMAGLLAGLNQLHAAIASLDAAVGLAPGDLTLRTDRARLLARVDRLAEALADYDAVLAAAPATPLLAGERLHCALKLADWRGFDAALAGLGDNASPYVLQTVSDDPGAHRAAAARDLAAVAVPPLPPPHFAEPAAGERLRIAYVSPDFHDNATMHLFGEALAAHDRTGFEIIAVSTGRPRADAFRQRAAAAVDDFLDVHGLGDGEAAALLRRHQPAIAVDLKGLTGDARPGLLAARAAPVQVNFLGFAGTMPAPWIDYMIVDPVVAPPAARAGFGEALVTLPHCYQPNGRDDPMTPTSRAAAGLPEAGMVFVCLNQVHKITPPVFTAWMRILAAVPDSVLWLWCDLPATRDNLRAHAAAAGIALSRLVFAMTLRRPDHLGRLALADLMLDTFPYNGHTTASDALKAGVPVLTRPGHSFASRVAASLLTTIGLPELIAADVDTYVDTAIALARDPAALARLRMRLAAGLAASPLLDAAAFARQLEQAYRAMHDRWRQGLAPADLVIAP